MPAHALEVAQLPFHHRDPFDRLLIAQAIIEGVPVVSVDSVFDSYSVERLW
jgi:PIN domain nuclease of toxin-antitoxin system